MQRNFAARGHPSNRRGNCPGEGDLGHNPYQGSSAHGTVNSGASFRTATNLYEITGKFDGVGAQGRHRA